MKRSIIYIILLFSILIISLITYATLTPGYMKIEDAPKEILQGQLVLNPLHSKNQRGNEQLCANNRLATHILVQDQKNKIPLFIEKNLRNLWGLLNSKQFYNYENRKVEVRGIRIEEGQCQFFIVSRLSDI